MKLKFAALLVALPAVIAGLLVSAPSEAADYEAFVKTRTIAISASGLGKVTVSCHSTSRCKGSITFGGGTRTRDFSVPAKSSKAVEVAVRTTEPAYPYVGGESGGDYSYKSAVLRVHETSPRRVNHDYNVTTETRLDVQQIKGDIHAHYPSGSSGRMSNLVVELVRELRGGNSEVVRRANVTESGSYSFNVNLGSNNTPSNPFKLRIRGTDPQGVGREWYWRGAVDSRASAVESRGGSRYIRKATTIVAKKYGDFDADFHYGSITGKVVKNGGNKADARVTVAAPPAPGSMSSTTRRELDVPYCADIFAQTDSDGAGNYRVDFLPFFPGDQRYMVGAQYNESTIWNDEFGSCLDVMDYGSARGNLIDLGASGLAVQNLDLTASGNNLKVTAPYSGFSPLRSDRFIRLREKVPGVPILSAPVIAESTGSVNKSAREIYRTFSDVPPGEYWIEVGRRTGCSDWYPSRFRNNDAYFSGADRGAERWKTVAGKYAEYQKSYDMGYVAKTPPSGYVGWMYRDHCKAYTAGTYRDATVSGLGLGTIERVTSTLKKGAVVKGKVTRAGGRTNKEMLVRLSSSDGKRVLRTAYTNGSGYFYVAGLPSGNWTISVNSDSWRGIGRSFYGKHSISVTAGNTYSAGTLHFRS